LRIKKNGTQRMISESFKDCVAPLETEGFGAWYEDKSEGAPVSSLFAVLHIDESGQQYILQALDARELTVAAYPEADAIPMPLLQLTMVFPFLVETMCFADTARILHRLNCILPVGSFVLSEDDKTVCLRAIFPVAESGFAPEFMVATLQIIRHFCVECGGLIEAIALSQMTYAEANDRIKDGTVNETMQV